MFQAGSDRLIGRRERTVIHRPNTRWRLHWAVIVVQAKPDFDHTPTNALDWLQSFNPTEQSRFLDFASSRSRLESLNPLEEVVFVIPSYLLFRACPSYLPHLDAGCRYFQVPLNSTASLILLSFSYARLVPSATTFLEL